MKWLLLLLALPLTSCFPTLTEDSSRVQFTCATGECVIAADADILEAYIALESPVTSKYCMGAVTAQPRPCEPVAGDWRALDLPLGNYGLRVLVGRIDKPPGEGKAKGFADVNLEGARESFRAELKP